MPRVLDRSIPSSGDAFDQTVSTDHRYSTGRDHSRWIQAPAARSEFVTVLPKLIFIGHAYASFAPGIEQQLMMSELADFRASAAASFWAFEDSLPDE